MHCKRNYALNFKGGFKGNLFVAIFAFNFEFRSAKFCCGKLSLMRILQKLHLMGKGGIQPDACL